MSRSLLLPGIVVLSLVAGISGCSEPIPVQERRAQDAGIFERDTAAPDLDAWAFEGTDGGVEQDVPAVEVDSGVTPDAGCESFPDLFSDEACETPQDGILVTEPLYPLWTDGLVKTRYLRLPEESQINTDDADGWIFPIGTVVWKTFATTTGTRLETRRMEKTGDGEGIDSWEMRAFLWSEDGLTVEEAPEDGISNVLGTEHDVPSRQECRTCHTGSADVLLGISAISLNHSGSPVSLRVLNDEDVLTTPIELGDALIPGNAVERAALGYLHQNCGGCHGGIAPDAGMNLRVSVADAVVEDTGAFEAVGTPSFFGSGLERIFPGEPGRSSIYVRTADRGANQMPPLGTERVDTTGLTAVETWIRSLDAGPPVGAPTQPADLRGELYSRTAGEIFWTRSMDPGGRIVGYEVTRNGVIVETRDASSYYDPNLLAGMTYNYNVTAVDDDGNRSTPATVSLTTRP